ncbi:MULTISPECIES: S-layer homology domain-containing protein [Paenibacillus]|uniref:S-layer homology domain-containing protein n=1 Tax=Paenibacillus TaxID=44249 RepID=UPI00057C8E37|nr:MULTISPECIES: S-layer homology domain-containing protein [Paenibacillus]AIY08944.1 glycoside hydrolase [Paenibacillus polymyxa]KAF6621107.1 S-layer homology domain-containing protein [Paenibacillus sp. EKM101P]KAF6622411.1 S-layer homology domain-containing protein [Paenibacillus sp. EKM102P]KAF6632259.1 S-layer homology domain-containing protein [Paenibacillus sp. EKM10P]KAF6647015.1 S-layer homology domain-containing protein [Paenibacillus sp. EKM11P]
MGKKLRTTITGVLSTGLILSAFSAAAAAPQTTSGHWAGDQVQRWSATGQLDGAVKPDAAITRAEFIVLLNRSLGTFTQELPAVTDVTYAGGVKINGNGSRTFTDVPASHWAYNELTSAVNAGYISGYAGNKLKPNGKVTRQEAAAIIGKAIGLTAGNAADVTKFIDSDKIGSWAKKSVAAVAEQKIINGYPDGKFQPLKPLTRAEAVAILDAASGYNLSPVDNLTTTPGGTVTDSTYSNVTNSTYGNTSTTSGSETEDSSTSTSTDSTTTTDNSTTTETSTETTTNTDTTTDTATDADATSNALKVNDVYDGEGTITGTAKAGSTVTAYSNDLPIGSAVAKDDGTFSISVLTQKATVRLVIKAKDTDGHESEPVEISVLSKRSE